MKLFPAVLSFEQGLSVRLSVPGTEYSISASSGGPGERFKVVITPARLTDPAVDGDIPDEMDCLMAQFEMFRPYIAVYLMHESQRDLRRIDMSLAHEKFSRSKVLTPHLAEVILINHASARATGLSYLECSALNMGAEEAEGTPNELERAIIEGKQPREYHERLQAVTLDYEPVQPPITPEDRAKLTTAIMGQGTGSLRPAVH